jgi:hypothetical protein
VSLILSSDVSLDRFNKVCQHLAREKLDKLKEKVGSAWAQHAKVGNEASPE